MYAACVYHMGVQAVPALGIVHEEEVEQSVAGFRQPGEFVFQVVVGLLPQTILTNQRKPGETLAQTQTSGLTLSGQNNKKKHVLFHAMYMVSGTSLQARCCHWAFPVAGR